MICETSDDGANSRDEHAMKCSSCPREAEPRLRAVQNFAVNGGQLEAPPSYVTETVWLCDVCALLEDVL